MTHAENPKKTLISLSGIIDAKMMQEIIVPEWETAVSCHGHTCIVKACELGCLLS